MKKVFLFFFLATAFLSKAQLTCANALPFCAGGVSGVTFPASTGTAIGETGPDYDCLPGWSVGTNISFYVPSPAWYYIQVGQSGSLDILIQGQIGTAPNTSPGTDVDFVCWGPFNSLSGICSSLTANMTVDCSYSSSYTETLNIANGVTGQYYMVMITNFYTTPQNIVLSQIGGTGNTSCSIINSASICFGASKTLTVANTTTLTNITYSIQPGGTVNTTGSFVVTPTVSTTYTTYLTGVTNLNQTLTATTINNVSVQPQPTIVPTVTNTSCTSTLNAFNLNLTFNPVSPVPSYTVTWASVPNGVLSNTTTSLAGSSIPAGPYAATLTAAGGCSTIATFTLNPIPAPALITIVPTGPVYSVTCIQPTVSLSAQVSTNNYTWTNGTSTVINGPLADITATTIGNYTIFAVNPSSGCTAQQTFTVGLNVSTPSAVVSPSFQNITCNLTSITTVTAIANPTVNITQQILSPLGGTFATTSNTLIYVPGGVGSFTHCVVNNINGCSSCHVFTVSSSQGFPTYNITSPDNFTLGCGTKSVATINIINGNTSSPAGGPVSYTLLAPGASSTVPSGSLSGISTYTVNTPGTWTVITKDNTSFCETRTPISVLSHTLGPDLNTVVTRTLLDCYVSRVTLKGLSTNTNVSYLWSFAGSPGSLQGDTITIFSNSVAPTSSVVGNYTLTIRDNSSTCKSDTVVIMRQSLYPPAAAISSGSSSLTCLTATIVLTNQSSSTIPAATGFSQGLPAIGFLWVGPSPQEPGQLSTTYIAATTGIYTLTAKDLNNGCTSTGTINISDNRIYPEVNKPLPPPPFTLDCGSLSRTISPIITGSTTGFAYNWISAVNATVSGQTTATLTTNRPGNYRVVITNTINGCSSSAEVSVVNGTLSADFDVDNTSGYAPLSVNFTNTSTSSLNNSGVNAFWNFGNSTSTPSLSSVSTASALYTKPGTYKVTLYATKGSCLDTAVKYIQVEIPSVMEIPNVFTPNGDNVNDVFFLKSTNLEKISILIYDRWGHVIFDSQSTTGNIAWDGKYQSGKEAAEGTYFYIIKATGKDGSDFNKKGTLSLFR